MKGTTTGWRIVVDADSVGLTYKDALRAELEKDPRVDSAIDVGIHAGEGVVALTDRRGSVKVAG